MILEAGIGVKAIVAGGGLVSGIALIAGMVGGGRYAEASADPGRLAAAVCSYTDQAASPRDSSTTTTGSPAATGRLDLNDEQLANARVIVGTADSLGLPERAAVIGVATALQESSLRAQAISTDGTSFGIFQQRPVNGWGTRAQVTDPRYAARMFFSRLAQVKGWQAKPLTAAAQAVQRSAFPDAYARHEARAEQIVTALSASGVRSWAPNPPSRRGQFGLPSEVLAEVRGSIEAAGSLGIDRQAVIADVARALRGTALENHAVANLPEKYERRAEKIVTAMSERLCRELTARLAEINDRLEGIESDFAEVSGRAAIAVQAALRMRGTPYSWGGGDTAGPGFGIGRGAGIKGFDCSALTQYAWARAGISIPRVTYDQWDHGTRVRGPIEPGDLVFYETNSELSGPDHVGLAVSGTQMVNAPFTGARVRVEPIRRPGFVGAVRPD
ncbi:NlpC/P60 family protein [Streptosporangium sp. NPDC051022]|uniref:C40 family peptidase n=1 Tax=Streptosporangium sp. NPDC051022 TaxID=3155752 RepID=UPI0034202F6E